ncbi:hypothetical protein [Litoreibacter roseus]|uniref:Uncharacterized protein n=1 Tax=Litoreibacter roseus TaxID=2601869 RepID=A0A6N6JLH0_9RHOB|nr:hypothetical protein [Litoreibacter roseus]GFE66964.1 hypothetical protein KIN_40380 [Litoreibacter roseus]
MTSRTAMRVGALCFAALVALAGPAMAQSPASPVQTETVSFADADPQATQIARRMYGQEFSHVRAVRVWLEAPSDDPEQLFVELGNDRGCVEGCLQVALFHNEQWLEIFRQPRSERLGLTGVTATGMKSIITDDRLWSWNARNYVPEPSKDGLTRRDANETELALVAEQVSGGFDAGDRSAFGPPEVDVYDVDMNGYLGKIIAVRSPAICGQSTCPVYLVNADDQIFRVLRSLEGEVGLSRRIRDEQAFRGIELLTRNGISIVSSSSGKRLGSVPVQIVRIAGAQ